VVTVLRDIDDLEPSVSQAHARLLGWHGFPCPGVGLSLLVKQHVTEIIWPPMRDAERHTLKDVRRQWPCIELVDPANSAHGLHLRPFTGTSKFFQDCAETREMLVKGGRVEGPCGLKKTAHHCMYRTAHDDLVGVDFMAPAGFNPTQSLGDFVQRRRELRNCRAFGV